MKNTYTVATENLGKIRKVFNRLLKKANRYGAVLNLQIGEPYAKEIPVWDETQELGHGRVRTELREVADVTIESEIIRNGSYEIVASIEHLEKGNVVWTAGDLKPEWAHLSGRCEHCGKRYGLRRTVIVRNADGDEKQVGKTCLMDYCGIDPQVVGIANELTEIVILEDVEHFDGVYSTGKVITTESALALACDCLTKYGYTKADEMGSNKQTITEWLAMDREPTQKGLEKAQAMISLLKDMDTETAVSAGLNDIRTFARCGYCKPNHIGYIAYAPLAYDRWQERIRKEEERTIQDAGSDYVGEIGKRMRFQVREAKVLTSWNTMYGMTYLYKMITEEGNVLIWKASGLLLKEKEDGELVSFTSGTVIGTVKDHSERDGVRQTIITRVKAA